MFKFLRLFALLALCCAGANTAFAQSFTYSVYVDSDNNTATGCNVTLASGSIVGAETVLTATVASGSPAQVTSVTQSNCAGAAFGAPFAAGNGAVTVGAGVGGGTSIELSNSLAALAGANPNTLRLYVVARSASGEDTLLTTTGAAGGAPILLAAAPPQPSVPAPLIGIPALLLLVGVLLAIGSRATRRRLIKRVMVGLVLVSGIAGAAIFNWAGIAPLATDPAGDTTSGENQIDLLAFFAANNAGNLYFRCDVAGSLAIPDHAPSFTKGVDQNLLEDAGAQSVPNWATAINDNDGGTQTLNFIVSNSNNALFSVQPAISSTGTLNYTLAANANGTALVTVQLHDNGGTANGGVDTSAPQTFNINVTAVNDAPSFTKGADENVLEDSGAHTVANWATALLAGPPDESSQTLNFIVSNSNNALFSVQPAIASNGTLTYTLAAGKQGAALVTVQIHDNGGTANGGVDTSAAQTFNINVSLVNHAPSFTKGADQTVLEDAVPQSVANWATAINDNDGNTQTLNFIVSNNNNALFAVQPAISPTGTLTYTLAANANGTSLVTVQLHDNGGTASGGVDTSAAQTFNVNVTAVNDAPSFTKGANESVLENSGVHSVPGWATAISAGPPDESAQTVTFVVTGNTNAALFSVAPAVATDGTLSYTLAAGATGTTTITLVAKDSGGTANGGSDTSAPQTFTITVAALAPTVTAVTPAGGPTAGGTTVTITGTDFTGATAVKFGAIAATAFSVNSATSITATAPAASAGTVDVTVTTPAGTSATSAADRYTYAAPPTVTAVAPTSGPTAGGTTVTITGTNLAGATAVKFGATAAASFTVNSATSITSTAPPGAAGVVNVTVTTSGGTSATSAADQYTFVAAPTVTGVAPTSGPIAGGTAVTITGTNLSGATAVVFGAAPATAFVVNSASSITATSPAGVGTVDIRVTTAGGVSATSAADQYTYVGPPTVTNVSPVSGPTAGGTVVTITGTNLSGAAAVLFGATSATSFTVNSATSITATSPAGSAGTVDVTVTTAGGTSATSAADQFTYVAAPTVTSVAPTSGPGAGGTSVTITGSNLSGATAVTFGATAAASFTVNSATSITAVTPAGVGTVDVRVTTAGGTSATSAADQYSFIPAPTVTSVAPTSGPTAGGTTVTITGTNFSGVTSVKFGATAAAAFTINSATSITATAPAGAAGSVDVTVTSTGGTSATSAADQYTYVSTPTVTGVSPSSGPTAGGTVVTITGTNLTGATGVSFGATAASSFTVNSATSISATAPAGTGTVDVKVTTAAGTSATSAADQYSYVPAPTVTAVAPTSGPTSGGTAVTITGTSLSGALAVSFGATPAASFTVNSVTSITAVAPAAVGTVDIRVTTAGGTSATSAADQFTFVAPPSITSVTPAVGPVGGGTTVTIAGSNLAGASVVTIGGVSAAISSNTVSQIIVTTPAHAPGVVNVVVTTSGGSVTATNAFTYAVPPAASNDTYATVGNTALVVGVAAPSTPYVSSSTLLLGNDTTSASPVITITQSPLGTVSNLNTATGAFVYTPPFAFTGTDTFKYTVTDTTTLTSTPATVTISVNSRVYYVNGAAATNGNGVSSSPLNTLASIAPSLVANDIVFVESGASPTTTPGAIALPAGVTLWGQGTSLPLVAGLSIVNTSQTTKPVLTSTLTVAGSNTTVSSLDVNTSGVGFTNSGAPSNVLVQNNVSVTTIGNSAISLNNAVGTFTFRSVNASNAAIGVVVANNVGGTFTVTGDGSTPGSGGTISNNTGTATGNGAVVLNKAGTVALNFMTLTSTHASGVFATDTSLTVNRTAFSNFPVAGVFESSSSGSVAGTFHVTNNTFAGIGGDAVQLQFNGSAAWTGHVVSNTIGTAAANSGSLNGNGLQIDVLGSGAATIDVSNNTINQIRVGYGILAGTNSAANTLALTLAGNTVTMGQGTSLDGISISSGFSGSTVCLNPTSNTSTAAGTAALNGQFDADGISVIENAGGSIFQLQGYAGPADDSGLQVETYLGVPRDTLAGPGGGAIAVFNAGTVPGFTSATCAIAPP